MRSSRLRSSTALGVLLAAGASCTFDTGGVELRGSVEEATFMLSLQDYRASGDFTEITARSFPSEVAPGANVRVWVSTFAAAAYREVDPAASGSRVRLPEGALLVREVYDGAVLKRLTLMGKD